MTEQPLISIIMPVYNGRKYLAQCLDSIVGQSYRRWQLIIVDDGSTDGSATLMDDYARRDERITVVHQPNSGPAAARNNGLARAEGQYVTFVDCDDWIAADMYETMVNAMDADAGVDVVIAGYTLEYASHSKPVPVREGSAAVAEATEVVKQVLRGHIGSYLWTMLLRREVVREPLPDMAVYEDHATLFKWLLHARRVALLPGAPYHYRQLGGSAVRSADYRKGCLFFEAVRERYHYIDAHRPLPGFADENRLLYIRGLVKLTKDLARSPHIDDATRQLICDVRQELTTLLPVSRRQVGLKYYCRLQLLLRSPRWYVRLMRLTSVFALSNRRHDADLY